MSRRTAFAGAALLLALLVHEGVARLLLPLPAVHNFHRDRYEPVAPRGELRCVDVRVESEPDGFRYVHRLNQHGFRGPEFPIARGPRRRVLALGDSFVEGWGADEAETIPGRLSELLGGAETINLGVIGSGLPQYAALVADAVPLLQPDDVVVTIYANDLPCPNGPAPRDPAAAPAERRLWLPRIVAAVRDVRRGHRVAVRGWRPVHNYLPAVPAPEHPFTTREMPAGIAPEIAAAARRGVFNPWQLDCRDRADAATRIDHDPHAEACLADIADTCRRHGVRLTLAYIPYAFTVSARYLQAYDRMGCLPVDTSEPWDGPDRRRQQQFLAGVAARLGVPFLDATDALIDAERNRGDKVCWTYDLHCTPAGYRVVAEALASGLRTDPRLATAENRGGIGFK